MNEKAQHAPLQGSIVAWETAETMLQGWPVIRQMYPLLSEEEYFKQLKVLETHDYRQFAFLSEDNRCLGVVGVWCLPRIWCGLQIDIDNFVLDQNARSMGVGRQLLQRCLEYAQERGAKIATLDTFVDNPSSHRFYFREGFTIRGYHFVKALQGQAIWPNGE
jgi:GNAT superfamily N-acetyltransferase